MDSRRRRALAPLLGAAAIILAVVTFLLLALQPKDVDVPGDDPTTHPLVGRASATQGTAVHNE